MDSIREIKIFLSLPGDLGKDFYLEIASAAEELNRIIESLKIDVRFKVLFWEKQTYPAVKEEVQQVINTQIDDYDIFTGVLWTRFGTPTKEYDSGTEEEFEIALSKKKDEDIIELLLYFRTDTPKSLKELDTNQLEKVRDFQSKCSKKGVLYHEFEELDDFKTEYKVHLCKAIQPLLEEKGTVRNISSIKVDENELSEVGFFELIQIGSTQMTLMSETITSMGNEIKSIGDKVKVHTEGVSQLNEKAQSQGQLDEKLTLEIINKFDEIAYDFEDFSNELDYMIPTFKKQYRKAFDAYSKIITITSALGIKTNEEYLALTNNLERLLEKMNFAIRSVGSFHQSIVDLPEITTKFINAKRKASTVVMKLLSELENANKLVKEMFA